MGECPESHQDSGKVLGVFGLSLAMSAVAGLGHLGGLVASTVLGGGFMNGAFPGNAFFEATKKQLELLGKPKHESGIQRVLLCSICYRDSRMLK